MPRAKRKISADFPYHLNARCINRDWFRLPMDTVWSIFCDYLWSTSHFFDFRIHSFVLMTNHFHLIASTPNGNLPAAMRHLMTETSREITRLSGRINQTYGGPYHPTLIDKQSYFFDAYRYVYQNPLKAGLCERVEEYKYSSLPGLLGMSHLEFPVVEDAILFGDSCATVEWLNLRLDEIEKERIRKALRKTKFAIPATRNGRKKLPTTEGP